MPAIYFKHKKKHDLNNSKKNFSLKKNVSLVQKNSFKCNTFKIISLDRPNLSKHCCVLFLIVYYRSKEEILIKTKSILNAFSSAKFKPLSG